MHLSKYASRVTLLLPRGQHVRLPHKRDRGDGQRPCAAEYSRRGREWAGKVRKPHAQDSVSGRTETVVAAGLFVLIGTEPRTEWLPSEIERDDKGFVLTGQDLLRNEPMPAGWPLERAPLLLETSIPGVFAAGDVRHRSVKRVAPTVGEDSLAIQLIHEYLG